MGRSVHAIHEAVRHWPSTEAMATPGAFRAVDAIRGLASSQASSADVAALIRQALRHAQVSGRDLRVTVPAESPWPTTSEEWRRFGLVATQIDGRAFRLSAEPWRPAWLGLVPPDGVDGHPMSERLVRLDESVPGDPFLRDVDSSLESYRTRGQREAVRGALACPPDSTLLVNLPTGSGKTLAAIAPALLFNPGLAVVVMPTTSLALDQERRLRDLGGRLSSLRFAYHGGLSDQEKAALREDIGNGRLPVLFTSPEALRAGLRTSVERAARNGYLRYFVVDEAHVVAEWGDEFRPEFQEIAGLRRHLSSLCASSASGGLRTLLLSATITDESLETLRTLFSEQGAFQTVSAVALRPEPAFWSAECETAEVRESRFLEALDMLPRPIIVYATLFNESNGTALTTREIEELVRKRGYQRVQRVDGSTPAEQRGAIVRAVTGTGSDSGGTEVDIVVANSAFGLGVDIPDIRSVVHLCVPETLDRYYQEVGRGGRDGRASVSLVLTVPEDFSVAKGLNRRKYIGDEKGFGRWRAMVAGSVTLGDGLTLRIDLRQLPHWLRHQTDENVNWNLRTLALMSRAGMVELNNEEPPSRGRSESEEDWEDRKEAAFEDFYHSVVVRILTPDHLQEERWQTRIGPVRNESAKAGRIALERMVSVLRPESCLSDLFAATYTPRDPTFKKSVQRSCAGCHYCRQRGIDPFTGVTPSPRPIQHVTPGPSRFLVNLAAANQGLIVATYDRSRSDLERRFRDLAGGLANHGVRCVIAGEPSLSSTWLGELHRLLPERYMFVENGWPSLHINPVATLVLESSLGPSEKAPSHLLRPNPAVPVLIAVFPDDLAHPDHPDRSATYAIVNPLTLDELLGRF